MNATSTPQEAVRWRHSMIVRVIALCGVLLMCLFGSVYVLIHQYHRQVVYEMEAQTREMAQQVVVHLEQDPDIGRPYLEEEVKRHYPGVETIEVDLNPPPTETGPVRVVLEVSEGGQLMMVARHAFVWGDSPVLLTTRVPMGTRAEVIQAFKNKYLLALTALFIVALGLMIYFIGRILRPLGLLSETCAKISEGGLENVPVHKNAGEVRALEETFNRMVESLREKALVESNLRQAQRLSALGNLAAGIAHDIRNPLNAIKLLSSHGMDARKDGGGHGVKQFQSIRHEVDRLESIVSGFLSLAKESEINAAPHPIDDLLRETVRLVQKDAEGRGVRLVTELRAGGAVLMVDPKQWTRAILNVLINAMEASPPGGRVRMFSRVTDLDCKIEIRDDGPGMADDVAERVFDPYFTTKSTGTGLGLSITRGIIEEHGGAISITGSEGRGCQVLITMPLEQHQKAS